MNSRVREIRKALGLSQKEFADKIGLKQNAISYMEKDGFTITEQSIKAICAQFSVSETWLRTGDGTMFIESEKRRRALLAAFDRLPPALQDYLIKAAEALLDAEAKMQFPDDKQ